MRSALNLSVEGKVGSLDLTIAINVDLAIVPCERKISSFCKKAIPFG